MLWDYIFVGGGLSASVVSNRLHHFDSSLKILVIEAGGNANNDESVMWPNSTNLIGGEYDWKYKTVPQVALNNRNVDLPCGKALGGGTVINSGEEPQVEATTSMLSRLGALTLQKAQYMRPQADVAPQVAGSAGTSLTLTSGATLLATTAGRMLGFSPT